MPTLQELIAQKEALERQIEEVSTKGRTEAIDKIKALMAENGLTLADLDTRSPGRPKASTRAGTKSATPNKVAAKYRNAATGDAWSGRGLQPKWLKAELASGKKIEEFAV